MGPWLFWHRRDLRLADNLGLAAVSAITPEVMGVFVLDPAELEHPTMAPARRWFLLESLRELQQRWRQAGSQLLLLQGNPVELLPRLAQQLGAAGVAWNRDVEPLVRQRDRELAAALKAIGVRVAADWDQLLVPPEQLKTGGGDPYRVYGPYWRSWEKQPKAKPVPVPSGLKALPGLDLSGLPVLDEVPIEPWDGADLCPCRPGETAALEQLELFSARAMEQYGEGRNLPGNEGTSTLSAALRAGSLSPRTAWAVSLDVLSHCRSDEQRQSVTVWQQELAWREFYQQALFHFPELADGPYRPQWRQFPWEDDPVRLKAWQDGLTGVPIVDAAMQQLVQTGFMHNRCRMIVASFLVKDLICDWRHGEAFFMAHEVDGDLAANNGGWQWSASSGMDPKPLRIFNPFTQASKFDPEATYIRRWLPELAHINTKDLISGDIGALERRGYPEPIVNHKQQQARFKALYAALPR
ncbi:deoxyribodipyrimidine photolyase (DNA photolyase) (photoreactivating enzyme) [Synechococcus sp. Minos11]|uniref:cryptochrome/photolyase family protein n=1 Tax=Synechococcus sp. Minos11 TaxID=221341 RepID=UPI001647FEED|nr:deoxyribodipyrimidine photo-lyase [Synechococcus sp. Minos11]QNJ07727.1 deoxyribodipyrimidine photolyase (DNA photolyase) (photoreactivating enzyme) [Synechococcus sp. Minos11]